MLPPFRNALVLTGPTGSGKSALGLELAERLGTEIVAMDSMTLYRGMDVGTAKPSVAERARVPHHLIDVLEPWQSASVAWWLERAAECCRDIERRGKRALFVGGTALYLKALLYGLFDGPPADEAIREHLIAAAERDGVQALHDRLRAVDPAAAERLHPNDVRRVVRALEVWELTRRPISSWQQQWTEAGVREQGSGVRNAENRDSILSSALTPNPCPLTPVLYLDLPRAELYRRIDDRVTQMIADGLIEEARALEQRSPPLSRAAAQALGYKEMFAFLEEKATLAETVQLIQTRSRNFAKRQLTWLRHLPECQPATRELTFALWQA